MKRELDALIFWGGGGGADFPPHPTNGHERLPSLGDTTYIQHVQYSTLLVETTTRHRTKPL